MADPAVRLTLGELADRFGLQVAGDPATCIEGIGTLAGAGPGQLAFLANPAYRRQLAATRAAAVVLRAEDADGCPAPASVPTPRIRTVPSPRSRRPNRSASSARE